MEGSQPSSPTQILENLQLEIQRQEAGRFYTWETQMAFGEYLVIMIFKVPQQKTVSTPGYPIVMPTSHQFLPIYGTLSEL